jgi:hypothetical protein
VTLREQVDRVVQERFQVGMSQLDVSVHQMKDMDPAGAYDLVEPTALTGYVLGVMVRQPL